MPSIEKEPIYDEYCISRRQYQRFLNILFWDVSVAHLVASLSGVVLGGVAEVVWVRISQEAKYLQHLSVQLIILFVCLFVCFVALRPKSTAMVIAGRSVHLTILFSWASLNKQFTSNRAHTFACN